VIGHNATVVWISADAALHTVTATDNSFNSGDMRHGDIYIHQFNSAGVQTYRCIYHSWMQATVIVKSG
jgi:plastocyanin